MHFCEQRSLFILYTGLSFGLPGEFTQVWVNGSSPNDELSMDHEKLLLDESSNYGVL